MVAKSRAGAVRKKSKASPPKGTGGNGRKALEGKGPTPKAEDREYHPAYKRKQLAERAAAKAASRGVRSNTGGGRTARRTSGDDSELVTGRNSVVEALRAKIPATTLYVATRIEVDDRVRESLRLANNRGIPLVEVVRPEIDRMTGADAVHQGIALKVPPYEYAHPNDLLDKAADAGVLPLIVALDGVTDPRNLGAIIRSVAAFGGQGVMVPQRRSAPVNAAVWKASVGAVARTPVAQVSNLTAALTQLKQQGLFALGLDGGGDTSAYELELADRPLVVVVGSEGKGLSRLVGEACDQIVSIPIASAVESLNASVAASVALYEIARRRAALPGANLAE